MGWSSSSSGLLLVHAGRHGLSNFENIYCLGCYLMLKVLSTMVSAKKHIPVYLFAVYI